MGIFFSSIFYFYWIASYCSIWAHFIHVTYHQPCILIPIISLLKRIITSLIFINAFLLRKEVFVYYINLFLWLFYGSINFIYRLKTCKLSSQIVSNSAVNICMNPAILVFFLYSLVRQIQWCISTILSWNISVIAELLYHVIKVSVGQISRIVSCRVVSYCVVL